MGPCPTFLNRNAHRATDRPLPLHVDFGFPSRGPCHASFHQHAHVAFERLLPAHPLDASPRRDPRHASLHRQAPEASGRHLPARPGGASPERGPCHAFLHQHPHIAFDRLLPERIVDASPGRGSCHVSLHWKRLRHLRPSPTGAPSWYISLEGPCHAFLYLYSYATSGHLLPAHLVCASSGRGALPRLLTPAPSDCILPEHPVGPFLRQSPCHASLHWHAHNASGRLLQEHPIASSPAPASPPFIGKPIPPSTVFCWST